MVLEHSSHTRHDKAHDLKAVATGVPYKSTNHVGVTRDNLQWLLWNAWIVSSSKGC